MCESVCESNTLYPFVLFVNLYLHVIFYWFYRWKLHVIICIFKVEITCN